MKNHAKYVYKKENDLNLFQVVFYTKKTVHPALTVSAEALTQ